MLAKTTLFSIVTALFAVRSVSAACNAGYYTQNGVCTPCAAGYYQPNNNSNTQSCTAASPGWYADGTSAATEQKRCGRGKYSPGATSTCTDCPAGSQCTSTTNSSPTLCSPGDYRPTGGAATADPCLECPPGQFNNVNGAKSCCKCCKGFYQQNSGRTSCNKCSSSRPGGPEGSDDDDNCTVSGGSQSPSTCAQPLDNPICPATTNGGPAPSGGITRRGVGVRCARGYKRCAVLSGRGGYDCVDVANDLESCGGCIDMEGSSSGVDCTAIEGTNDVKCQRGQCVVRSCRGGYQLTNEGICVPSFSVQNPHVVR